MTEEKRQSKNSWATQEAGRKVFWARAGELGFDRDGVHAALGVESIYDLTMQLSEALVALENAATKPVGSDMAQYEDGPEVEQEAEAEPEPERDEIDLADLVDLAEAPASVNFTAIAPGGFNVQWTLRDRDERRMYLRFKRIVEGLSKAHYLPCDRYGNPLPVISQEANEKARQEKPTTNKPTPPSAKSGPPPASTAGSAPQHQGGGEKSGTALLNKIAVDADGRVEFHVGRFRWPFKDGRGPEVVAGLFDQSLGWTPGHFAPGAKYDGEAVIGLMVDWEKPDKYYNVIRVHAA